MPVQVLMPQLGESVIEGTITKWLKEIGDEVQEFEPLLEVNTDKVDTEIPSPVNGILSEILVAEGTVVQVGTLLAWIKSESGDEMYQSEPKSNENFLSSQKISESRKPSESAERVIDEHGSEADKKINLGFISPVVSKIARENNIDLSVIKGTGQGGRITKNDVLVYIKNRETKIPKVTQKPELTKIIQEETELSRQTIVSPGDHIPITPVRKAIADHMLLSRRTSPHVTTVMEADLSKVIEHRSTHKELFAREGVNLTFTAYFVYTAVQALRDIPIVNSRWNDSGIEVLNEFNIGIATALGEEGLIVPVIKNADRLSLLGLASSINDLSNRARSKRLIPDEVSGGTFTITNHGTSGSLFATPIINQPQCAIMGVGAIQKRAVVIQDAIAIRAMAYLSLTFDHRILDGVIADRFLARVVEYLNNWP